MPLYHPHHQALILTSSDTIPKLVLYVLTPISANPVAAFPRSFASAPCRVAILIHVLVQWHRFHALVAHCLIDLISKPGAERRVHVRRHDLDYAHLVPGYGIQLQAERDAEAVGGGLGGAVDRVEADGDMAEARRGKEDGGGWGLMGR